MRVILFLAIFASAAGCSQNEPRYFGIRMTHAQIATCNARGGRPEQTLMAVQACVWPTSDAGKSCQNRSDCQGYCQAPWDAEPGARVAGECSAKASDHPGGCGNPVKDGIAMGALCID